jgi:excisionase family DNA binding protein
MQASDILTYEEAARELGLTRGSLRQVISRGALTSVKLLGTREKGIRRTDIERYKHRKERTYTPVEQAPAHTEARQAEQGHQPEPTPAVSVSAEMPAGWTELVTIIGAWIVQAIGAWVKNAESIAQNARAAEGNARAIEQGLTIAVKAAIPVRSASPQQQLGGQLLGVVLKNMPPNEPTERDLTQATDSIGRDLSQLLNMPYDAATQGFVGSLAGALIDAARKDRQLFVPDADKVPA